MKKHNILIVEDDFINAQFIEQAVVKLGHNVIETVDNGKEALEIIEEEPIHIVFMDINIDGDIDGIECAKRINKTRNIPIIYTTAFSDSQTISDATNTNLYGYLIKPFDHHDIEAVLNLTIKQNYLKKKIEKNSNAQLFTELNNGYKYYAKTQTLIKNEEPINLTKKESSIFYYLFNNLNQTVTNEYLTTYVWDNKMVASSTIRDTILRLRKKIPDLNIRTVSGLGYALEK